MYGLIDSNTIHWPSQANVQSGSPQVFSSSVPDDVFASVVGKGQYISGSGQEFVNTVGKTFIIAQQRSTTLIELDPAFGLTNPTTVSVANILTLTAEYVHSLINLNLFEALICLSLPNNFITTIAPLSNLHNLRFLSIRSANHQLDLTPLIDLTNLEVINAEGQNNIPAELTTSKCVIHTGSSTPIVFTDSNLENAIQIVLDKSTLPIRVDDVKNLKTLNLSGRQISDLTGLELFTELTHLDLAINNISDLTPILQLPLVYLNVAYNPVG